LPHGIIGATADNVIISFNKQAEKLYGYTSEEVIGRHLQILVFDEQRDVLNYRINDSTDEEKLTRYPMLHKRKDSTPLAVCMTIYPRPDKSGIVIGVCEQE
jgi:PAS domain S-box-containing protein